VATNWTSVSQVFGPSSEGAVEQGAGSKERGAGSGERGARSKEQGARSNRRLTSERGAYLFEKSMGLILLIIVILLLIGAFPTGGYGFGYRSHGLLGTILIIILILWLLGRI
jgi:Protein of unknown function (DUF3309)